MGPSRPELEELLRPSLDPSADPARMREAWSPWQISVLALLGGPLAAGYLYGENYRRLGRSPLMAWCLAGSLVVALACGLAAGRMRDAAWTGAALADDMRLARTVARFGTMLAVVPVAYAQQRRFRVFTGSGGEPGALWRQGLFAALALGFAGNYLVYQVMRWTA